MHGAADLRVNLFPAYANQIYWLAIGGAAAAIVGTPAALIAWARTPYATGQGEPPDQPIKFDHRHHVRDDGITCEYCHGGAARSSKAGIPATSVCVNCHSQIWTTSPELAEVRRSYFANEPIRWKRVNALPDFVFFDHSAHVNKGVGCVTCHGRIDRMGQVYQARPLTMRWCLECHRAPEEHLRPLDKVTDMEWTPDRPQEELGRELRASLGVRSIVECSGCHR
ncbi:MAG: cytochrome c3 family protein [Labilithrix sp.]|nr:cytochrome c3 family protein [Labilithrix sp.]MBX3223242.1 cytochrome c3 family protein [Labilithrix sp.]